MSLLRNDWGDVRGVWFVLAIVLVLGYWLYESADNEWVCTKRSEVVDIQYKITAGLLDSTETVEYRYKTGELRIVDKHKHDNYPEVKGQIGCAEGHHEAR